MSDSAPARRLLAELVDDRRARGHQISPTQVEQAAILLAGLWGVATRYTVAVGRLDYAAHLPRAALDVATTPPCRPPDTRRSRPHRWQYRRPVEA